MAAHFVSESPRPRESHWDTCLRLLTLRCAQAPRRAPARRLSRRHRRVGAARLAPLPGDRRGRPAAVQAGADTAVDDRRRGRPVGPALLHGRRVHRSGVRVGLQRARAPGRRRRPHRRAQHLLERCPRPRRGRLRLGRCRLRCGGLGPGAGRPDRGAQGAAGPAHAARGCGRGRSDGRRRRRGSADIRLLGTIAGALLSALSPKLRRLTAPPAHFR